MRLQLSKRPKLTRQRWTLKSLWKRKARPPTPAPNDLSQEAPAMSPRVTGENGEPVSMHFFDVPKQAPPAMDPKPPEAESEPAFTHFYDLPQECRDMIYIYWPKIAWIDVAQTHPQATHLRDADRAHDKSVNQPNISKVCRRMRHECLDVFYGRNKFLLDLRGWKHHDYPKRWTPLMIFEHWIDGIGDANAGRLRSLSFWSHNFRAHVKVVGEHSQQLVLKFRPAAGKPELAENAPAHYTFEVAATRAEAGLQSLLDRIQHEAQGRPLSVEDVKMICTAVVSLQPFLCKRSNLGSWGAILPSGNAMEWPSTWPHLNKCDDCGYHRFTRGED